MNIPDKAVEAGEWAVTNYVIAADEREYHGSQDITQEELRRVYLEAAFPIIAAQALRDMADAFGGADAEEVFLGLEVAAEARRRADELETGK